MITKTQVQAVVRGIIAENPEGHNDACRYIVLGKAHCIAARAVQALGLDPMELREGYSVRENASAFLAWGVDEDAVSWLQSVQRHADGAVDDDDGLVYPTWAVALEMAGV